jgi:hypothetical protein
MTFSGEAAMATVFRIRRPGTLVAHGAEPTEGLAAYMGRLVRLIPAEVLAVYQTLYGILSDPQPSPFLIWLPVLGIALVILVRMWGTRDESGSWATVQWAAVFVATVSFIIWVMVSKHSIGGFVLPDLRIGSALMVLWVFAIPYFYKGS